MDLIAKTEGIFIRKYVACMEIIGRDRPGKCLSIDLSSRFELGLVHFVSDPQQQDDKRVFCFIFIKHQTFIWFLLQNIFIFWQRKWSENYGFLNKPQVEFNLTEFRILYRERNFFLQRAKSFHRERNLSTVKSFIYLINTVIIYGTYCLFIDSLYQS